MSDAVRAGRRPARRDSADRAESDLSVVAAYELLLPQLARLRAALGAAGIGARPIADVRREHAELDQLLARAVEQAFAADALDAPRPSGLGSWASEGLARSRERELALFAAADATGILQANTAPNPRWDDTRKKRHS